MYSDYWGIPKMDTKWYELFKSVRGEEKNTVFHLVNVARKGIFATDGRHALKVERQQDCDIANAVYVITQDRLLVEVKEESIGETKYPDMSNFFDYKAKGCDKTATITFGKSHPLASIVCAIQEFGCFVNLDYSRKTLEAIDSLEPEFARIYGFKDIEVAKEKPLLLEFMVKDITAVYAMFPLQGTEEFITVDEAPLFKKKAG